MTEAEWQAGAPNVIVLIRSGEVHAFGYLYGHEVARYHEPIFEPTSMPLHRSIRATAHRLFEQAWATVEARIGGPFPGSTP